MLALLALALPTAAAAHRHHWFSKMQRSVALSSAEAEFSGAMLAAKEVIFIRELLIDLGWIFRLQQRLPGAEGPPEGCSTAPRHAACGGPIPSSLPNAAKGYPPREPREAASGASSYT